MMDLPTAKECEEVFHAALSAGDTQGVYAALFVMGVQDPARAQHLLTLLDTATTIAQATRDNTRSVGLRIVGLISGQPSSIDGQWVVEYDPTRPGTDPNGRPMTAHVVCSPDPARAHRFATVDDAHTYWRTPSGRTRPDGQPDRPLTAFTIITETLETTP